MRVFLPLLPGLGEGGRGDEGPIKSSKHKMTNETQRYYLVRHGVTEWNRVMRFQGHTDVPLDAEGREQALKIGARIAALPEPPVAIYSSDLRRARDTAEAIAAPLGLTVSATPELRETYLGAWEGLNRAEIEARGDGVLLAGYIRDSLVHRPPDSETIEAVYNRMNRVWDEIRAKQHSGPVAIVGHGGSLRALICAALDAPLVSMQRFWLDNASLSILEEGLGAETRRHRVVLVNDTGHLRG